MESYTTQEFFWLTGKLKTHFPYFAPAYLKPWFDITSHSLNGFTHMAKTLIIKTGATGDVIRTTVLLHIIKGEVYWLTALYNASLLPSEVNRIVYTGLSNPLPEEVFSSDFDLVINLEEDPEIAKLATRLRKRKLVGVFWEDGQIKYTPDSANWFDMSLISVHGKQLADELKRKNRSTHQEILFNMLGKEFKGEKYLIYDLPESTKKKQKLVGIEKNVGARWPNKKWEGYEEMNEILKTEGYETIIFPKRNTLNEYIAEIRECNYIITGDTLAMHIALAHDIPCLAIFTCTSPHEIYDYGILTKVASPRLAEFYYNTAWIPEATRAVSVKEVIEQFRKSAKL